ncbi:lipid-A-disaccharide synthase [Candidatus Pelagibacter sp.]|nr:lipid-A-disaccharide synthase [Candidatus Pelagibacter sp.]
MKKIFILTGEPSGDKLAAEVIKELKKSKIDVEYLSVGGQHLNSIGIKSIYDQKDVTYIAFTDIFLNIFKIKRKINETVKKILDFNPDILFSVDSPDFTLRVSKIIKLNKPNIKTIHFIAPKVWAWREGRVKKMKNYIDHILLLFDFEKKYFDKEKLKNTFVGHPILDDTNNKKIEINELLKNNIISIFPGSRLSELKSHVPILIEFIKKMNEENINYNFVFHATQNSKDYLLQIIKKNNLENVDLTSNESIKIATIKKSIFAIVKSGTVSLEVCKYGVPSIIIYKMNFFNFFIAKLFLKIKFANMINIINNKEIIPELLQKECNSEEIYKTVNYLLKKPEIINEQLQQVNKTIERLKSNTSSRNEASNILLSYLR